MIWIIAVESIIIVAMSIAILYYRHQMVYWDNIANEVFNDLYEWQQKYYGLKQEYRIVYARLRKAEKVTERQNAIADAIESRDFDRLQAEMGGWNDHITPLILVMGLFGTPDQFRKTTKEEVKKKYAYKVNPELFEELRDEMIKEVKGDLGVEKENNPR